MNEFNKDLDAPDACEELMEELILLEGEADVEPEEESEDPAYRRKREAIEQQFARFERNYRSRRIRELTLAPFRKKGARGRSNRTLA